MGQIMHRNMVVQFNEQHKWCGCFGIVSEVGNDKCLIGVPIPNNEGENRTAFIFAKRNEIEIIGESVLGFEE